MSETKDNDASPLDALMHSVMRWKNAVPLLHEGMAATLIFGIGFAPITALALSLMGIFTLPFASLLLVIPALGVAMGLSCYQPRYGRLMLHGFVMGIIAVTCYDCVRIPFIMAGWMDDFIPKIGGMLVGDGNHHAVLGYLWRYLGNGGGMGMAFVCAFALLKQLLTEHQQARITPLVTKHIALGFGCFVWACLIVTLKISLQGEVMMFVITPTSLLLSWIGHLVFGYTLGCLVNRFGKEGICKRLTENGRDHSPQRSSEWIENETPHKTLEDPSTAGHSPIILPDRPECQTSASEIRKAAKRIPHGRRQLGPCPRAFLRQPLRRLHLTSAPALRFLAGRGPASGFSMSGHTAQGGSNASALPP